MSGRVLKAVRSAIIVCIVLMLVLALSVWVWLITGERSVTFLLPSAMERLVPLDSDYGVEVDNAFLHWDTDNHVLTLDIHDVQAVDKAEQAYIRFPRISLGLRPLPLLMGDIAFSHLTIYEPRIWIQRDLQGQLTYGLGKTGQEQVPVHLFIARVMGFGENQSALIRRLEIRDAFLYLQDFNSGITWQMPDARILMQRTAKGLEGKIDVKLSQSGAADATSEAAITANFRLNNSARTAETRFKFTNLYPSIFADLNEELAVLHDFSLPLSGWVDVNLGFNGEISLIDFKMKSGEGRLASADHLESTLYVRSAKLKGSLSDNLQSVYLEQMELDFGGPHLSLQGAVSLTDEGVGLNAEASFTDLPTNELRYYWPVKLAPDTRSWVTERITGGTITRAGSKLLLHPGDLQKDVLPETVMDAIIDVEGATVNYASTLPPVTDVDARVKFANNRMDIEAHKGSTGDARATGGTIIIPDLLTAEKTIQIELDIETPAKDVAEYLKEFSFAPMLNMDPAITQGDIRGRLSYARPIGAAAMKVTRDLPFDGATFSIIGTAENFSSAKLLNAYSITSGSGDFEVDNKGVRVNGKAAIFDIPAALSLNYLFYPESDLSMKMDMELALDTQELSRFGFSAPSLLNGPLSVSLQSETRNDITFSTNTVTLDNATLTLPWFGYTKPKGQKSTLTIASRSTALGNVYIDSFKLTAEDMQAEGALTLDKATGGVRNLTVKRAQFGKNDFALGLAHTTLANGDPLLQASLTGNALDLSDFYNEDELFTSGLDLPHMALKADILKVIIGKNREVVDFKGKATCTVERCLDNEIIGLFANGNQFSYTQTIENDDRILRMASNDAGELFRVLGIYDNIQGGTLDVMAIYDDSKDTKPLEGTLVVRDHRARKAPVLTKILNIASLTGVVELLQGSGIQFSKMSVPFKLEEGVITFRNAKSVGSSLGITAEGYYDTGKSFLDIKGTIVPSYTINSLLGNIPILGEALMGGENQGLFAATFNARGPYKNVDVSVNPLTILAPGFLRNLFDGAAPVPGKPSPPPNTNKQNQAPQPPGGDNKPPKDSEKPAESPSAATP